MNDKEKLEAIKKVLDNTGIVSPTENYFERHQQKLQKSQMKRNSQKNDTNL